MINDKDQLANSVVSHMMENDFFSQWMGVEVLEVKEGHSRIRMTVRKEMVNGFGIVHGGLPFPNADEKAYRPVIRPDAEKVQKLNLTFK